MAPTKPIPVLDFASPQGNLSPGQWRKLADDGVAGIWAKCGNGNNKPDPTFRANIAGARTVEIAVGAYGVPFVLPLDEGHHPGRSPLDQAQTHFQQSGALGIVLGDLPPMVDLEWPAPVDWPQWGVTPAFARAFALLYLGETARLTGRSPFLYLYPDYEKHLFAGATQDELEAFAKYRLWIARYGVTEPGSLPPWTAPTLWQKSDGGAVLPNGCRVDEDLFLGDADAWDALKGGL
jgi:GH25 family lysozyme M1 (1,4-beta-N-acetylmuramidase)